MGGFGLVSVLLPVLNSAATLPQQLEALSTQTYTGRWELVVADNGSTDGSDEIVRSWSSALPHLHLLHAHERKGCSYARNVAARAARGDFLVSCDADDIVAPDWLARLVEAGRHCDIVGGGIDQASLNDPISRSWRPGIADDRLPVALNFLPYAVGANCGIRAEVLSELGGWDEELAVSGDDVELSWRAQLASYRLCFAPEAIVSYRFRDNPLATARQFYNYGRVEPYLYRRYREQGAPRSSTLKALKEWVWLVLRAGDAMKPGERGGAWRRKAAYRRGRLRGSLRHRVVFL